MSKIPVEQLFGKSELDELYEPLITMSSLIEKREKERLKHAQKEFGKRIMEIVEKEYPEFKGKFTLEWEKYE